MDPPLHHQHPMETETLASTSLPKAMTLQEPPSHTAGPMESPRISSTTAKNAKGRKKATRMKPPLTTKWVDALSAVRLAPAQQKDPHEKVGAWQNEKYYKLK